MKEVSNQIASNKEQSPLFTLLDASQTGISFVNPIKQTAGKNIMYYDYFFNGGGIAIGDINNDGLSDLYFTGNMVADRLYINQGSLRFKDITESAGTTGFREGNPVSWSSGTTMVDINGDGYLDIYVCKSGPLNIEGAKNNLLYINNGDLTFTERAKEYGIDDPGWTTQACFFDFDKDGDLDLYVLNHFVYFSDVSLGEAVKNQSEYEKYSSNFYRNEGGNKFKRITKEAGMIRFGYGLGVVANDLNDDGWVDLYVSCDFASPDFMFINNGDGTFTDEIKSRTNHISYYGMGCDIADINNDGFVEISVVDMTAEDRYRSKTLMPSMDTRLFSLLTESYKFQTQYMFNTLQLNNGNGTYSDIANLSGVHKTDWSWANLFGDFDNDGSKDLFVSNGFKQDTKDNDFIKKVQERKRELGVQRIPENEIMSWVNQMESHKTQNFIYKNNGDLSFTKKSGEWGMRQNSFSNGAAYGDLDNDGDLDLVVNNIDDPAFLYRNNARDNKTNHFLRIQLKEPGQDPLALNTKVRLYAGGEMQFQELTLTRGFQSSVEPRLHFGLAEQTRVDSIIVEWLDGTQSILRNIPVDNLIQIVKDGTNIYKLKEKHVIPLFTDISKSSGLEFLHRENLFDDFAQEVLLPHKESNNGPYPAVADVNGDNLNDIFIGGSAGYSGKLYLQNKNGKFTKNKSQPWENDKDSEDVNALFFDFDGDKDQDLYVASGGGGDIGMDNPLLQDRLYVNDGKGNFKKLNNALPAMLTSTQAISSSDFDQDGDLDLFVGGRIIPAKYPHAPRSYLLENKEGSFIDVTQEVAPELSNIGMVTGAVWSDYNKDGYADLILVGEWMCFEIFENNGHTFSRKSQELGTDKYSGWWQTLVAADLDQDGDEDFVLGNIGLNTKFHASIEVPFSVYSGDLDGSGTNDIVLVDNSHGTPFPVRGRECSSEQIPKLLEKFPTYREFANADIFDVYGRDVLQNALHLNATEFKSGIMMNKGEMGFEFLPFENNCQISPIRGIVVGDYNNDREPDILAVGNLFGAEVETVSYDAGIGYFMKGLGNGNFKFIPVNESGFYVPGDSRGVISLGLNNYTNKNVVVATVNNDYCRVFETSSFSGNISP